MKTKNLFFAVLTAIIFFNHDIHAMTKTSEPSDLKRATPPIVQPEDPFEKIPEFSFDYHKPETLVYSIRKILAQHKIITLEDNRLKQLANALAKTGIHLCDAYPKNTLPIHVAVEEDDGLVTFVLLRAMILRYGPENLSHLLTAPNAQGHTLAQLAGSSQRNGWTEDIKNLLYHHFSLIKAHKKPSAQ